jgi:putative sterol carrier protein
MLQSMPLGFDLSAAPGLETVYQFEISGDESFTAHLKISAGACSYHDGPSAMPAVVIQSPARVWLAVSRGELDGQQAFMAGKYKVEGDLSLLLKLRSLFKR